MGLIAAAAVVAVGAGVSAYMSADGKRKALNHLHDAYQNLDYLNVDDMMKQAKAADVDKYKTQLDTQKELDPNFANMRTTGSANVLQALQQDATNNTIADQSVNQLRDSTASSGTQNQGVIDSLVAQAKEDLAAGASLPPEFQAELVKAGLEKAGMSGQELSGSGATGSGARTLLGSAGINLKAQRQAQATQAMSAAQSLQQQRQSALTDLVTLDNNLRGAKVQRATGAAMLGNSTVPGIGLTGGDKVNMNIANLNQKNQATLAMGGLDAQKAMANAEMWSKIISSTTSAIGGAMGGGMGGMGGAGGGAGGGSGGGDMSWIGGLLSNKSNMTSVGSTTQDPYGVTYRTNGNGQMISGW